MSLLGAHYWLLTGRDWEQDRETMRCDFAICEHDHTGGSRSQAKKPGKWFIAGLILAGVAWVGAMAYAGHQLDKSLIKQQREVHLRLVHNTTPTGN